jgi:ABC-2 type transport system permease protein
VSGAAQMTAGRAWRAFVAQLRVELLLAARRYENLLVTLAVPVVLLVFLSAVPIAAVRGDPHDAMAMLVPRIVAVALLGTGLVSLGIATAYERGYGVLKRLAGSPLPHWALLASKTIVVLLIVAAQLAVIGIVAVLLGWAPPGGPLVALARAAPWVVLGTIAFSALGLLLAGTLRPEAVLAAANGLYLVFILLGGVVVPADRLPQPLPAVVSVLPPSLLTTLLEGAMTGAGSTGPAQPAALLAWAIGLAIAATAAFRVD